ncbi:MAG: DUF1836 domain-containing protein [Ruminococcaceae bacterium]|nr:DUF1836 domain-containing protein [Oscillospiraceae bacterium]
MTREKLIEIAVDAVNESELKAEEIPNIDLYIDQILNLVSVKLDEGSERYKSRSLTKTMINNYSKDNVISPVKGKKYTREQVIQILYIYSLKNTLSIGEIKRLLKGAYSIDGFEADDLTELYKKHHATKAVVEEKSIEILQNDVIDGMMLDPEDDVDYISIICALVSMSASLKNIAQAMIDEKFPDVAPETAKTDAERAKKKQEKILEKEKAKAAKAERKNEKKHKNTDSITNE